MFVNRIERFDQPLPRVSARHAIVRRRRVPLLRLRAPGARYVRTASPELGDLGRFGFHSITHFIQKAIPREIKRPVERITRPIERGVSKVVHSRTVRRVAGYALAPETGGLSLALLSSTPAARRRALAEIGAVDLAVIGGAYALAPSAIEAGTGAVSAGGAMPAESAIEAFTPAAQAASAPTLASTVSSGASFWSSLAKLGTGLATAVKEGVPLATALLHLKAAGAGQGGGGFFPSAYAAEGAPSGGGYGAGAGVPGGEGGGAPGAQPESAPAMDTGTIVPWVAGGIGVIALISALSKRR